MRPEREKFYSMKTRIITFILSAFILFAMQSCLALTDTSNTNKDQNENNSGDKTEEYYKLTVNGSSWQIHKTKATLQANADQGLADYTATIIAVDASNSIVADSKQLRVNFNASDLESVMDKNLALDEDFNIMYRAQKESTACKYSYKSGIMAITELGEDYAKITFNDLVVDYRGSLLDPEEVTATLSVSGSIKCAIKK